MFKSPVLVATDVFIPGSSTLNVRTARPRHWAASAFLAVLLADQPSATLRSNASLRRCIIQLCGRASFKIPLPFYGSHVPVLGEVWLSRSGYPPSTRAFTPLGHSILDSLVSRPHCGLLERSAMLARARPPHCILRVRSHWACRAQSLFLTSRITLLAGSGMALSLCSLSFALYPISSLESYAAPQFAQNCWSSLRYVLLTVFPMLLTSNPVYSHLARAAGLAHCYAHMPHALLSGPMAMQFDMSPCSEPALVSVAHRRMCGARFSSDPITNGYLRRPTSSSTSINAILNVFIAIWSHSGHPRLQLIPIMLIVFYSCCMVSSTQSRAAPQFVNTIATAFSCQRRYPYSSI
ncbi:hypothetical protein A0H81_06726 [Grifola frondosa]|uniref:Uncharacterized protein n=1 Tax=Grifola frondosa TaxID=5627 RepID=A0A1C7MA37_GRIFR|nr:hypothetical protein A0H81_08988 [Grifola frondosa]OBZ73259.1 hypothetical protein A0H81_06726 [Grifola frondosa]